MKHGFLLIDKPLGPTSHDVVAQIRKALPERSIGHLGTLDPAASGLLVLAVGTKALKVIELFQELPKEYEAEVTLGTISSTYDSQGALQKVKRKPGWEVPDDSQLHTLIQNHFLGTVLQMPPAYSAIHIDGERAYDLARAGIGVEMPTRQVQIEACEVLEYKFPKLKLRVACSSGTYIRSIAHDIGNHLGCGGYLSALRRTRVGEWLVDFAVAPEAASWSQVMPLAEALLPLPRLDINEAEWKALGFGQKIARTAADNTLAWFEEKPVAILKKMPGGCRARKVIG